ncbi:MAG: mechanosensitive ion channel family protein [Nitrospira sp.]
MNVKMTPDAVMSWMDLVTNLAFRYGLQVLGALTILTVGALLARWAGGTVQRWLDRQDMEPPVRSLIARVVRGGVFAFAVLAALDKFGVQIAPLIAGLGVAGLGAGLALQGVLSNVVAGLTIIITKPFSVGEYVEIIGVHGEVVSIDLFSTVLRHRDQSKVVVPNREIVGEVLRNYGVMRQLNLSVGVAYGSNLTDALRLARQIVAIHPRVLKYPEPLVGIATLGDSAIVLSIQPWVKIADYGTAQAELYQTVIEQFRAHRIEMPLPQREVRMLASA